MEESSSPPQDYERIEKAIRYIEQNHKQHPTLRQMADHIGLSEYHFQRLFTRWAGTSPQRLVRFLTKEYAKEQLAISANLLETTHEVGLSSPSRLYDLFVTYEAMTPAEFRARGAGMTLRYGIHPTPFGPCLIVVTDRGITDLHFLDNHATAEVLVDHLRKEWPNATLLHEVLATEPYVNRLFTIDSPRAIPLPILIRGTNFQIKVWEALLRIPPGHVVSYDAIARTIGQPTAARAVGTAIGSNRIAYLIPCHRVLQKSGGLGGYRWGTYRKQAMLAHEAGQVPEAGQRELF